MLNRGYVTKSLFVEFCDFPKLARWKQNRPQQYKKIKQVDNPDEQDRIIAHAKEVEQLSGEYLQGQFGGEITDCFVDDAIEDMNAIERNAENVKQTLAAIKQGARIIFQPGFIWQGCFVRGDYLVRTDRGGYVLYEVKGKTRVRKKRTLDGEEYAVGPIEKRLQYDCSFQKWVINNVLEDNGIEPLESVVLISLNNEYIKQGPLDINQLFVTDTVDCVSSVTIEGESKTKTIQRDDRLMSTQAVEEKVAVIEKVIELPEDEFNSLYPYPGNRNCEYFGEDQEFGTVMAIPQLHFSKAKHVQWLYSEGRIVLDDLTNEEIGLFENKSGGGATVEFFDHYFRAEETPNIDYGAIAELLDGLSFPLCFYDYESIAVPIPVLDDTAPYQQVVVQYSLHKYYKDGTMKHYGGVLGGTDKTGVESVTIPSNPNRVGFESEKVVYGSWKNLLEEFIIDVGDDIDGSTFIMWSQGFENARNREIAEYFASEHTIADFYTRLQEEGHYFDLMDVFSNRYYFDRGFEGSVSIKKVLPVLVPSMSYDRLEVGNGGVAMKTLYNLICGNIPTHEKQDAINNLLLYCGQDSLAMVKIYEVLIGLLE